MLSRILLLAGALLSGPASSADFSEGEPRQGVPVVHMRGAVVDGDYARFEMAVAGRKAVIVDLEGPGGKVVEAVHIARRIKAAGFETSVRRSLCASACSMIWLAGSRLDFGPGARIGFHGPYLARTGPSGKREVRIDRFADGEFSTYLRWLGVDPALERFALSKGPDELNFLSRIEAVALGLRVHDGSDLVGRRASSATLSPVADSSCLATIGEEVRRRMDEDALASCVVGDMIRVKSGSAMADPDARHAALSRAGVSQDLRYVLLARYDAMAEDVIARTSKTVAKRP